MGNFEFCCVQRLSFRKPHRKKSQEFRSGKVMIFPNVEEALFEFNVRLPNLGESCLSGLGCDTPNSDCYDGICQCDNGFVGDGGECVPDENPEPCEGGIGDPCEKDEDCDKSAHLACNLCLMKCDCAHGYFFDTTVLLCVTGDGGLGDACSDHTDCNANLHYHCNEEAGICTCADDYELDVDTLLCASLIYEMINRENPRESGRRMLEGRGLRRRPTPPLRQPSEEMLLHGWLLPGS
ncbi:unnamed protein product [Darwinula stevensoni]|uniref:EB domain-containing protein n=1 Tax=Darwinula stevensoni TaxID=69355 RepID=A0A7R9A744_9CRUS|nr:unnamed protein product [Darwinula stevensoni]CAG0891457.1 unnamed protein product [Darwinula stevensoni]